jgi:hypothetical protein
MKRSQALELLKDSIFKNVTAAYWGEGEAWLDFSEEDLSSILADLEAIGMLPSKAPIPRSVRVGR